MSRISNSILYICLYITATMPLLSCNRHFIITGNDHKQYSITSEVRPDSAIIYHYLPYKEKLDTEMNTVLGYTSVDLTKPAQPETTLGNFFADAILTQGRKLYPEVDFAIGTKGGLRTELTKGSITLRNMFELMPFENKLVILHISGKHTADLLQFVAAKDGQPIAGIRMKIKNNEPFNVLIEGKPFDTARSYIVLTYDFLANGGDNITGLNNPIKRINTDKGVREALIEYVIETTKKGNHLNSETDGRIIHEK